MKTEILQRFLYPLLVLLSSCASKNVLEGNGIPSVVIQSSSIMQLQLQELQDLPPAKRQPVIAVYSNSLQDLTGQRKSNSEFALFSTAITQAPEAFLIRALNTHPAEIF